MRRIRGGSPRADRSIRPLTGTRQRLLKLAVAVLALVAGTAGTAVDSSAAGFTTPTWQRQIGVPGHAYVYPWGIAMDPTTDTILVGDYNNYNIKRFSTGGTLMATYSSKGRGPGQLSGQPYGVAVDPNNGNFYVAVLSVGGYMRFDTNGNWLGNVTNSAVHYAPFLTVNSKGNVYLVQSSPISSSSRLVLVFDNTGKYLFQFGSNGNNCNAAQFALIRGIDVDAQDNVYVDDVGNRCIQVFQPDGTFLRSFGNSTQLSNNTRGMTIDKANNVVYVADSAKQTVEVFSTAGTFQGTIGVPGSDDGQLGGPRDIAVGGDGTVYVSDYTYWRINAYHPLCSCSTSGQFIHQIPDPAVPPPLGGLNMANGVAVSPVDGSVYVTDTFNQRVQQFTNAGTVVTAWGSRLPNLGDPYALDYPRGVAVDPNNGNVWVNDTRSGYIKEYSSSGTFIQDWGGIGSAPGQFFYAVGITVGPDGTLYITDSANARLQVTDQAGNVKHVFTCGDLTSHPWAYTGCNGSALDAVGNIYATNTNKNRIDVFSPTGSLLRSIGSTAPGGRLNTPYGVAIAGTSLYVTEAGANRVSKFNINGAYVGQWGSLGTGHGQLNRPLGIAVDTTGNIYVNDYGNDRIEVFSP
ncbi:MAG: NHL repeat-containing protein [Chloroflexota bacterium]|nr:NHL repeat-containing protein [Chloroflexota bacterium]